MTYTFGPINRNFGSRLKILYLLRNSEWLPAGYSKKLLVLVDLNMEIKGLACRSGTENLLTARDNMVFSYILHLFSFWLANFLADFGAL